MVRVHKTYSWAVNAITHTPPHNADEVFTTAMLAILFPVELYRTRDQVVIDSTDVIVYDVGGEFNPEKKRFDHHQKGFSEIRPDGIIYSSAGLIWREYGVEIVKKLGGANRIDDQMAIKVVSYVDNALIRGIDARDNGQGEKGDSMSVSSVISTFNVLWDEDEDADICFVKACEIARMILEREIKVAISSIHGQKLVKEQIEAANGPIIIMDKFIDGWQEAVLTSDNSKAANLLYAVFPAVDGSWNVKAIPPTIDDMMAQRKPFPEGWRGLKSKELVRASGVETAIFCHTAGFFAVAKTKEDAISLAEKAVNS
ncbi:MYG1 family protein [Candidatus Saccharibacteria bacterium]|nr:MYG1 family protein [Candidatus Saccharibacteria bacterium]